MLRFINEINRLNHSLNKEFETTAKGLDDALEELRRITRPGSNLFIVSDFKQLTEKGVKNLYNLSQHNDISAIQVFDPLEQDLPVKGYYSITDGEDRFMMYTGDRTLRSQYHDGFQKHSEALKQLLGPMGIPIIQLSTLESPLHYFRNLLGKKR